MQGAAKQGSVLEEEEPWRPIGVCHAGYGLTGAGAAGAAPPVAGAGEAGVSGMAALPFALPPCTGAEAGAVEGAVAGAGVKAWSSTDFGARCRAEASERMNANARKMAPPHQLVFVSKLPAWRVPSSESAELLTPPKLAASPFPLPLCSRMAAISTKLSMISRTSRTVNISEAASGYRDVR